MKSILSTIIIVATSIVWEPVLAGAPLANNIRSTPQARRIASDLVSHSCVDELYNVSLVIVGEIIALSAVPKCDGSIRNNRCQMCPSLLFHSVKGGSCSEKKIEEFSQKEFMDHEEAVDLGIFGLGALIDAFDDAPTDSDFSKLYGFSEDQNCAGLLLNMLVKLGMNPNGAIVGTFVSRHLSKKSP